MKANLNQLTNKENTRHRFISDRLVYRHGIEKKHNTFVTIKFDYSISLRFTLNITKSDKQD